MYRSPLSVPKVAGAYVALHALLFAAHKAQRMPLLAELVPSADVIGLVSPVLFFATALCFWAAASPSAGALSLLQRVATACAWLLVALPTAYLVDGLTNGGLGLDNALRASAQGTASLGRLSPNSGMAFLLTGGAFLALRHPLRGARQAFFIAAAVTVGLIGLAGIVGHLLGLESLYQLPRFNRLLPPTAVAFAVVGAGLWSLHDQVQDMPLQAIEGRILRRTLAVIALVALGAGVAGFAVMRASFEEAVAKNLSLTASTAGSSLSHTIKLGLAFPRTVATRTGVGQALATLSANESDESARELLQRVSRNILGDNLARAEFYNAADTLVAQAGAPRVALKATHALKGAGTGATLGWNGGYVLVADNVVRFQGQRVGRIVTEQRLPVFDQLLADVRQANESSDAAICGTSAPDRATCAPTRFRNEVFTIPLRDAAGRPAFPVVRALLGQTGVLLAKDPRGVDVVSAHVPLADYGPGLAVKTDVSTLYAPLRARLALLVASVLAIIGLAIYALRSLVRPVVGRLADSERNLKAILEEQTELVSLARPDGTLTYVNPAYARQFGHSPEQMLGQNLFDHVAPADLALVRGVVASVLDTGQTARAENRVLRPDGAPRWIAWMNTRQMDAQGRPMLHSVGRDITERKAAELALQESQAILARTGKVAGVGGWELVIATGEVKWTEDTRRIHEVPADYQPTLHNAMDFYDAEARGQMDAAVQQSVARNEPFDLELRLRTAKGRHIWVRSQGQVELKDGVPVRLVGAIQDVTERRELELRLAANERFMREVTDSLPVRIAYMDRELRFQFANVAHARRFGLPREQIIGRTRTELTGAAPSGDTARAVNGVLAGEEQVFEFEEQVEGRAVRIESHLIPDLAADGSVRGFYSTGVDVTERSAAERVLRDLTTIFDNTPDYVVQTDWLGQIVYVNPAARAAFAADPADDMLGKSFREFLPPRANALLTDSVIPAARAQGVWVGETDVLLAHGRAVPVSHMLIAHRSEDGRVHRFSAIMRDISLEVAAKQREQRDAATLRSVTESMPAMVAVVGSDRSFRFVNSAFERWLGRDRREVVGRRIEDVLGAAEYERSAPFIDRALNGEAVNYVRDHENAQGLRHQSLTYVPMRLEDGRIDGYVGIAQDITEQKNEESRLLQLSQVDALTGLLNRAGFDELLAERLRKADAAAPLALFYIDLDRFKPVNDTHGHAVGDQLLRQLALRLRHTVRPTDGVARLGGDEFAVVVSGVRDPTSMRVVANNILAVAQAPFDINGLAIGVGASIGIALAAGAAQDAAELLARADAQLYRAKAGGRGRMSFEGGDRDAGDPAKPTATP